MPNAFSEAYTSKNTSQYVPAPLESARAAMNTMTNRYKQNRKDVLKLSKNLDQEARPKFQARKNEIIGGLQNRLNDIQENTNMVDANDEIFNLTKDIYDEKKRGELAAIKDQDNQYQAIKKQIQEAYPDNQKVQNYLINNIQEGDMQQDGSGNYSAPVSLPDDYGTSIYSTDDIFTRLKEGVQNMQDTFLGSINSQRGEGAPKVTSLNEAMNMYKSGKMSGKTFNTAVDEINGLITADMRQSEALKAKAAGAENPYDYANTYARDEEGDYLLRDRQGRRVQMTQDDEGNKVFQTLDGETVDPTGVRRELANNNIGNLVSSFAGMTSHRDKEVDRHYEERDGGGSAGSGGSGGSGSGRASIVETSPQLTVNRPGERGGVTGAGEGYMGDVGALKRDLKKRLEFSSEGSEYDYIGETSNPFADDDVSLTLDQFVYKNPRQATAKVDNPQFENVDSVEDYGPQTDENIIGELGVVEGMIDWQENSDTVKRRKRMMANIIEAVTDRKVDFSENVKLNRKQANQVLQYLDNLKKKQTENLKVTEVPDQEVNGSDGETGEKGVEVKLFGKNTSGNGAIINRAMVKASDGTYLDTAHKIKRQFTDEEIENASVNGVVNSDNPLPAMTNNDNFSRAYQVTIGGELYYVAGGDQELWKTTDPVTNERKKMDLQSKARSINRISRASLTPGKTRSYSGGFEIPSGGRKNIKVTAVPTAGGGNTSYKAELEHNGEQIAVSGSNPTRVYNRVLKEIAVANRKAEERSGNSRTRNTRSRPRQSEQTTTESNTETTTGDSDGMSPEEEAENTREGRKSVEDELKRRRIIPMDPEIAPINKDPEKASLADDYTVDDIPALMNDVAQGSTGDEELEKVERQQERADLQRRNAFDQQAGQENTKRADNQQQTVEEKNESIDRMLDDSFDKIDKKREQLKQVPDSPDKAKTMDSPDMEMPPQNAETFDRLMFDQPKPQSGGKGKANKSKDETPSFSDIPIRSGLLPGEKPTMAPPDRVVKKLNKEDLASGGDGVTREDYNNWLTDKGWYKPDEEPSVMPGNVIEFENEEGETEYAPDWIYNQNIVSPARDRFLKQNKELAYDYGAKLGLNTGKGKPKEGKATDCSDAVCRFINKETGFDYDRLYTGAWKWSEDNQYDLSEKKVSKEEAQDGDVVVMKTSVNDDKSPKKQYPHVGVVAVDQNSGQKFILEVSNTFNQVSMMPLEMRERQLEQTSEYDDVSWEFYRDNKYEENSEYGE